MGNHVDDIKRIIIKLRNTVRKEVLKSLNIDKCERVIEKLDSFSTNCEECQAQLLELKNLFLHLKANGNQLGNNEYKQTKQLINNIVSHLQKKHKLLPEGYYLSIFMSVGISLGVVFGLTIFDNIGLGIPVGMTMGIAIGIAMDEDAKKKGKTIK